MERHLKVVMHAVETLRYSCSVAHTLIVVFVAGLRGPVSTW